MARKVAKKQPVTAKKKQKPAAAAKKKKKPATAKKKKRPVAKTKAKEIVFYADDKDAAMQRAKQAARDTFGYFWREMAWEARRIVPALEMAAVKAAFRDKAGGPVEEMWIGDPVFDGKLIRGTLLNQPNALTSVSEGDRVELRLAEISDWMYVLGGSAYGAFTVQAMRLKMSDKDRKAHDEAWGFEFGDPQKPRVAPDGYPADEHPMALNMRESLEQQLKSGNALAPDAEGFSLLHHMALAGSPSLVSILLAHGADPSARTRHGMTAAALAKSLGWTKVAALLRGR